MPEIKGYSVGDIHAEAAFTSEIVVNGFPPLQTYTNHQNIHRVEMDARPGMYPKYLPQLFDPVNGEMRSGGAYLFDTYENVSEYWDWTTNVFEGAPNVKFWSLPLFKSAQRFIWHVIGAVNFMPVDDHAVGRFQRWRYEGSNIEAELKRIYPELKQKAKDQGAAAFWLMYQPEEKQICIQLAFPKVEASDPAMTGHESLAHVTSQVSLGSFFPESIKANKLVDRTSMFLTIWLPKSRLEDGVHYSHPMYPTLPAVEQD
jgi:hypothetical protein